MLKGLPPSIEKELFEHFQDSYSQGVSVRRKNVLYSAVVLSLTIAILSQLFGVSGAMLISVTVAVSSLCIAWAILSMSAAVCLQGDTISRLMVHYLRTATERDDLR